MSLARLLCQSLLASALLWSALALAGETTVAGYSVAMIPVIPPSDIKRRWQPVLDRVNHDSGLQLQLRFFESVEDFEKALAHDEVDVAIVSPAQLWRFRHHYLPLLRPTMPLMGVVVVHRHSAWQSLAELGGSRVVMQEGETLSTNVLVLQALRALKVQPELRNVRTESNALRSVILGKAEAAVANNYLLELLPEISSQLRIIYRTPELPPPAIITHERMSPDAVQKLKQALLHLREIHSPLLKPILMPDITEADMERDYAGVPKTLSGEGNGNH